MDGISGFDRDAALLSLPPERCHASVGQKPNAQHFDMECSIGCRLCKAGIWTSSVSILCGHEHETAEYFHLICPTWAHLRFVPELPKYHDHNTLPPCTLQCGIFMHFPQEVTCEHKLQPQMNVPYVQPVAPLREGSFEICADR